MKHCPNRIPGASFRGVCKEGDQIGIHRCSLFFIEVWPLLFESEFNVIEARVVARKHGPPFVQIRHLRR